MQSRFRVINQNDKIKYYSNSYEKVTSLLEVSSSSQKLFYNFKKKVTNSSKCLKQIKFVYLHTLLDFHCNEIMFVTKQTHGEAIIF